MTRLSRPTGYAIVLGAALALLTGAAYFFSQLNPAQPNPVRADLGGDFTLESATGPVSLEDYRGQVVVLVFGYTACPDICPTSLATLASGLNQLGADQQHRVQPIFISVDPGRDTPANLARYVTYFHPRLIGVTGSKARVDAVVQAYGAFYRRVSLAGSAMEYSVDHSTRIYLLDERGRLAALLYHDTTPDALAAALRELI